MLPKLFALPVSVFVVSPTVAPGLPSGPSFMRITVPSGGGAPGSSAETGLATPGGGTKVGAGCRSDGGIGIEPAGAWGTPVAPTDGTAGLAGTAAAGGRPGAGMVGVVGAGTYSPGGRAGAEAGAPSAAWFGRVGVICGTVE